MGVIYAERTHWPLRILFAADGKTSWAVAWWGPLADSITHDGANVGDILDYDQEKAAPVDRGLWVFEGGAYWMGPGYYGEGDWEQGAVGKWRKATGAEVLRYVSGMPVWDHPWPDPKDANPQLPCL